MTCYLPLFFYKKNRQTTHHLLWQMTCCLPAKISAADMVAGKLRLWVFIKKKTHFSTTFKHKTPLKHQETNPST
jgi:hypothetical protein